MPVLVGDDAAFLVMVGFFLLAQVGLRRGVRTVRPPLGACTVARSCCCRTPRCSSALVAACAPGAGSLLVPVAVYGGVLTAMAVLATGLGRLAAIGGAVFLVSDGLIALEAFVPSWDLGGQGFWVMLTYVVGQGLLAAAVVGPQRAERRGAGTATGPHVRPASAGARTTWWRSSDARGAQPIACTGADSAVPDMSRRGSTGGSSTGWPAEPRGPGRRRAHPREDERVLVAQEPVRPDAAGRAALAGVRLERRDLGRARPACRAGPPRLRRRSRRPCRQPRRGDRAEARTTRWPAASLMPAMPPAARPCGRTAEAGKCSSEASERRSTSSSASATARDADHLVAVLERDRLPRVAVAGDVAGRDALDGALHGGQGERRRVRPRATSRPTTRSRGSRVTTSPSGHAAGQRRGAVRRRQATAGRAPRRARCGPATSRRRSRRARSRAPRADTTSCLARRAPSTRAAGPRTPVRASRPGPGQQHPARGVGDLERSGRAAGGRGAGDRGAAGRLEQDRAARGAVRRGDLRHLVGDERAQPGVVGQDLAQLGDLLAPAAAAPSRARSGRTW